MQRTTLLLPEELKRRAEKRARSLGLSFGQLVRNALELALKEPRSKNDRDVLFSAAAVFDGPSPVDLAAAHDRYLYGDP